MVATLHSKPGAASGVDNLILVSSDTHIGPKLSHSLLRIENGEIVAGLRGSRGRAAKPLDQIGRCRTHGGRAGGEV